MRADFLFGEVSEGLRRNVTMTLAMILTTAVSLTMLGGGILAIRIADKTEQYFLDRLEVRLYLTEDISANDPDCVNDPCRTLMADLKSVDGVETVQYLNRDAAVREAKEKTFKDQPELAEYVSETPLPASLRVKMTDAALYPTIYEQFSESPGVGMVRNDKDIVDRLVSLFDGLRNAAFGMALLQAVAALLLIANMVQIAAFTRRTEVHIMRLVGATRWYTQLPFLLEAVVAALAGGVLATAGLFAARPLVIDRALGDLFASNVFPAITFDDIFTTALMVVPVGVVFAGLTAYATLRWYVRE
ncbi:MULTISPECIES: permease-like cell division protein FtsX [Nocardia]|uniref:permease-like cell division protein FtsX n=1 Tax=Nocardia TaxID=1817 RepID=UPI001893F592|nr:MULTISPECIES: permease-like cell division protein FtsX [Nocardia]MBF6350926.1 ABC transporter permease [Nocardia flavorosea]